MSSVRLLAIGFIYLFTAVAWSTLGASVVSRTGESDARLSKEVAQLWGGRHNQIAPQTIVLRPRQVTETVQGTDNLGQPVRREVTRTVRGPDTGAAARQPRPGWPRAPAPAEGAALVRHLHRRLQRRVSGPQPGRSAPHARRRVPLPVGRRDLRRLRAPARRPGRAQGRHGAGQHRLHGPARARRGGPGRGLPLPRARRLDLRVRPRRREQRAGLRAGHDDGLPAHRFPAGHHVADHEGRGRRRAGAWAGSSTAWSPDRRWAWTCPTS